MSATRKLGIRRVMTPNQVVAYNVFKARALRGWTQEQAAEALAPYLGAKLSGPSFSALERSATKVDRIKQFSADDLPSMHRLTSGATAIAGYRVCDIGGVVLAGWWRRGGRV